MKHTFRTAYDGLNKEQSNKCSISFLDEDGKYQPGRTEQSHKHDCDINSIIKKYDKTGLILHVNQAKAQYGDYTQINEYQQNLNMIIDAQDSFEEMPSSVRKRFGNDPGLFLEYISNPENDKEMIELGLALPKIIDPIQKVEIINPIPPKYPPKSTKKGPTGDVDWPLKEPKSE